MQRPAHLRVGIGGGVRARLGLVHSPKFGPLERRVLEPPRVGPWMDMPSPARHPSCTPRPAGSAGPAGADGDPAGPEAVDGAAEDSEDDVGATVAALLAQLPSEEENEDFEDDEWGLYGADGSQGGPGRGAAAPMWDPGEGLGLEEVSMGGWHTVVP